MSAKLEAGYTIKYPETLGELRFWGLRKERQVYDDENNQTGEIDRRTYNLISSVQQDIIPVILPGQVPIREFPQDAVVEPVNPVIHVGVSKTFRGAEAFLWMTADDIIAAKSAPPKSPDKPNTGK